MNFRSMTDDELHFLNKKTAEKQREITLELLNQLNEVERRHLYSKFRCSSLHDYCVSELKMTSGNATHHMNAARLLREIPSIEEKVLNGAIPITTITQAEAFFKREAKAGNRFDSVRKESVLTKLQEKSTREADKILIQHSAQPEIHLREKITQKTESLTEVRMYLDEETMQLLARLKEIWSNAMPNATIADLVKRAADDAVEKHDPLKKVKRAEARAERAKVTKFGGGKVEDQTADRNGADPNARHSPMNAGSDLRAKTPALGFQSKAEIRRAIWKRDQSQCTFVDRRTGEQCRAKHFVEEDHIIPNAMDGEYTVENIRLRCRTHNQRHAIDCYGLEKMRSHMDRV